jgi:hypothetical protein
MKSVRSMESLVDSEYLQDGGAESYWMRKGGRGTETISCGFEAHPLN